MVATAVFLRSCLPSYYFAYIYSLYRQREVTDKHKKISSPFQKMYSVAACLLQVKSWCHTPPSTFLWFGMITMSQLPFHFKNRHT